MNEMDWGMEYYLNLADSSSQYIKPRDFQAGMTVIDKGPGGREAFRVISKEIVTSDKSKCLCTVFILASEVNKPGVVVTYELDEETTDRYMRYTKTNLSLDLLNQ